jgi:hypothetical protein
MTREQRRFTLKLALKRGMNHEQFLRETSAREVREYMALNLIDPVFEGERIERAVAALYALTYNVNRDPDKTPAASVSDCIPDYSARFRPAEREQTIEEMKAAIDGWLEVVK